MKLLFSIIAAALLAPSQAVAAEKFMAPHGPVPYLAQAALSPAADPFAAGSLRLAQAVPLPPPAPGPQTAPGPGATVPGTTVTTQGGNVESNTKISVGTWAGEIATYVATAFGGVIASFLILILKRVATYVGATISDQASDKLQSIVERGLVAAAAGVQKMADGKIPVDLKSKVVADAVRYVETHAKETLETLGTKPGTTEAAEVIKARVETAIVDPTVPVTVSNQPAPKPAVPGLDDLDERIEAVLRKFIEGRKPHEMATAGAAS